MFCVFFVRKKVQLKKCLKRSKNYKMNAPKVTKEESKALIFKKSRSLAVRIQKSSTVKCQWDDLGIVSIFPFYIFFIPSFVLNAEQTASVLNFAMHSQKIETWCAWLNAKFTHLINGKSHTELYSKIWTKQNFNVEKNRLENWLLIPEIHDDHRFPQLKMNISLFVIAINVFNASIWILLCTKVNNSSIALFIWILNGKI